MMITFSYLQKGISALARSHQTGSMSGHLGAAVLAGYYFSEDHADLDHQVFKGVQHELDRIIEGEETIWYDAVKSGVTIEALFESTPGKQLKNQTIPDIAEALSASVGALRQSGHNVIFGSLALRALHDHPELASPSIIDGISKLMHQFDRAVPGRGYYGKERGWLTGDKVALPDNDGVATYHSVEAMIETVVDLLIETGSQHRRGFGGLFHIINHAAALSELAQLGYQDLVHQGLAAHRHHVRLWRSLPVLDEELGVLKKATNDPRTPNYWDGSHANSTQWSGWLTHRVKTLHGFFRIAEIIEDTNKRQSAEAAFRYLMA